MLRQFNIITSDPHIVLVRWDKAGTKLAITVYEAGSYVLGSIKSCLSISLRFLIDGFST